jgi:hypothetical protein
VHLEAGEAADVTVRIAVPAHAAEGEQLATVWAEMISTVPASSDLSTISRTGVRTYLSVGPGNGPAADFTITRLWGLRTAQGNPLVIASITNTGGRSLDLSGSLTLSNAPSKTTAGPFTSERSTALRAGEATDVVLTLDPALVDGPWDAALTVKSGLLARDISGTVSFTEAPVVVAAQGLF